MCQKSRAQQKKKKKKLADKVNVNGACHFIADGTQSGLPTGAVVYQDYVASYLENISPREKPVVVYVAREL